MDIAGAVAIVTGGGAGTGRDIAARLAREGATVVVADRDPEGGTETVREIEAEGGRASFVRADVRIGRDIQDMVWFAERTHGGLDILVNNAGGTPEPHFPDAAPEHWGSTLDLNLRGPMLATQLAVRAMRDRGGGAVVNIASVAGLGFRAHDSPEYAAAKAGLIRFTATLAPLRERLNVRVNCVIPHWIDTELVREEIAAMTAEERSAVPVLLQPEEVADAVVAFIQDDELAGRITVLWCEEPPRMLDPDRRE
jgi:NAD(P)-dependent dehydrogenase (short-subunit alcohol dehydrogenase family)